MRARGRLLGATVVALAVAALTGAVGFVAGREALDTRPAVAQPAKPATVVAHEDEVADVRNTQVELAWQPAGAVVNRLGGTVTWSSLTPARARRIGAGEVLYSVDERRVVVMQGAVPAYRDLGPGASGPDVLQVQQFLLDRGYTAAAPTGSWTSETTSAYRRFRAAQLLPDARSIPLGEVLFVPTLPVTATPSSALSVGGDVAAGEEAVTLLADLPRASYRSGSGTTASLATGTRVTIDVDGATVAGATAGQGVADATGNVAVPIVLDGVCDTWCDAVPTDTTTTWPATVEVVPATRGIVVPVGAITTSPDGTPTVELDDGHTVSVVVVAQVGAQAVVEGVADGTVLVLPHPSS